MLHHFLGANRRKNDTAKPCYRRAARATATSTPLLFVFVTSIISIVFLVDVSSAAEGTGAVFCGTQQTPTCGDGAVCSVTSPCINGVIGITINRIARRLYLAESGGNRIRSVPILVTDTVATLAGTGSSGSGVGAMPASTIFDTPVAFARGDTLLHPLYLVADSGNDRLVQLNVATSTSAVYWGGSTDCAVGVARATGSKLTGATTAFVSNGRVYAAGSCTTLLAASTVTDVTSAVKTFANGITSLVVVHSLLYVTESTRCCVDIVNVYTGASTGTTIGTCGSCGDTATPFAFNDPSYLSDECTTTSIYIGDTISNKLKRYNIKEDSTSVFSATSGVIASNIPTQLVVLENVMYVAQKNASVKSIQLGDQHRFVGCQWSSTATATMTDSPTSTATASDSVSPSFTPSLSPTITPAPTRTQSPSWTGTNTMTNTNTPSQSGSPTTTKSESQTNAPTDTKTASDSNSQTGSPTITSTSSVSLSKSSSITVSESQTESPTASQSKSPSVTVTESQTESPTASKSDSLTNSPTTTKSVSETKSESQTESPTDTLSHEKSLTYSRSLTTTPSQSKTDTQTISESPSSSPTLSSSGTSTLSTSASHTTSPSPSPTGTISASSTSTLSNSLTTTLTATSSVSISPSATPSGTFTGTPSQTLSPSVTGTLTRAPTPTATISRTFTRTPSGSSSASPTESRSLSKSMETGSGSLTPSPSIEKTTSYSKSITPSVDRSATMFTKTVTFEKNSMTYTFSMTVSNDPPTITETASGTNENSASTSPSISVSHLTPTREETHSATTTVTLTHEVSGTVSDEGTTTISVSSIVTSSASISVSVSRNTITNELTMLDSSSRTPSRSYSNSRTRTDTDTRPPTTTPLPPTTTEQPTPSFTLPTRCPDDCMNGRCNNKYPYYCQCYADTVSGHWTGWQMGGPCDKCDVGWWGPQCVQACAGGACNPCSGNGVCNDGRTGDGKCTCHSDSRRGFWNGTDCSICQTGYFGPKCNVQCNCHGRGQCDGGRGSTGKCKCEGGWDPDTGCSTCLAYRYGTNCLLSCEAINTQLARPCNGHGRCDNRSVNLNNEKCTGCDKWWGGATCDVECKKQCSGHGVCKEGVTELGGCVCNAGFKPPACDECIGGYWGPTCSTDCPGGAANPCSKRGKCDLTTGKCTCDEGFGGSACELLCPRDAVTNVTCGHGTCKQDTVTCACHLSASDGFWRVPPGGNVCTECVLGFDGSNCNITCPVYNGKKCNGHGSCASTNVCTCEEHYCGKQCERSGGICTACPLAGRYGINCDKICQCSSHGTCSEGVGGDGTCACARGWASRYCDRECDGGKDNPCSNSTGGGVCLTSNGECKCNSGFAGTTCNLKCPRSATNVVCSNHGKCSDGRTGTGLCQCVPQYVGAACNIPCLCWEHGKCDATGACTCNGNWYGEKCDSCRPGWSGSDCHIQCVNGTTNGTLCKCYKNFGAANCTVQCASSASGELCSGHGECEWGSDKNGMCKCSPGWEGKACGCSVQQCKANPPYPVYAACDYETSNCICDTFHDGYAAQCIKCASRQYYGPTCQETCTCQGHGVCDASGRCTCDTDDVRGHWTGSDCSTCASGYMGTLCNIRIVLSTQTAAMSYTHSDSTATIESGGALMVDEGRGILFAAGRDSSALVLYNTNATTPASARLLVPPTVFGCSSGIIIQNMFRIPNEDDVYYVYVAPSCGVGSRIMSISADGLIFGNGTVNATTRASLDFQSISHVAAEPRTGLLCRSTIQHLLCTNWRNQHPPRIQVIDMGAVTTIYAVIYLPSLQRMIVLGREGSTQRWGARFVHELNNEPVVTAVNIYPEPMNYPSARAAAAHGSTVFIAFETPQGSSPGLVRLTYDTENLRWNREDIEVGLASEFVPTLAGVDEQRGVLYAVFRSTKATYLTKCHTKDSKNVYSQQPLTESTSVNPNFVNFKVDNSQHMIYLLKAQHAGVEVARFLQWEVEDTRPEWVDARGGTVVTVIGNGFFNSSIRCNVDGSDVPEPGTYLNSTHVTCRAPSAKSAGCTNEVIEVSMNGWAMTKNEYAMRRADSPRITSASPPTGVLSGTDVELTGEGFINTTTLLCKFSASNREDNIMVLGVFVSSSKIQCRQPPYVSPTRPPATIDVSLDGQTFSGAPIAFPVLGIANNVTASMTAKGVSTTLAATNATVVPSVSVYMVDVEGNSVEDHDTLSRVVTAHAEPLTASDPPCNMTGETTLTTTNTSGKVVFDRLALAYPLVGYCRVIFSVKNATTTTTAARRDLVAHVWTVNMTFRVLAGAVVRLNLTQQPAPTSNGKDSLSIHPVVSGIDVAGNLVTATENWWLKANILSTIELKERPREVQKMIHHKERAVLEFAGLVIPTLFGSVFRVEFTLTDNSAKVLVPPVQSSPITPVCPGYKNQSYWIHGETSCRTCDVVKMICNGTDVTVAMDGYWRSANAPSSADMYYKCAIEGACVSQGCATGHEGPTCAVCAPGYFKEVASMCTECNSAVMDTIFVVVVITAVIIMLFFLCLINVKNNDTESNFHVIVQMCVSYVQITACFLYLVVPWNKVMWRYLVWMSVFADIRMSALSPFECSLRRAGGNFTFYFPVYFAVSFLASLVIGVCVHFALSRYIHWFTWHSRPDHKKPRGDNRKNKPEQPAVEEQQPADDAPSAARETHEERKARLNALMFVPGRYSVGICIGACYLIVIYLAYQGTLVHLLELRPCKSFVVGRDAKGENIVEHRLTADLSVNCDEGAYKVFSGFFTGIGACYGLGIPVLFVFVYHYHSMARTRADDAWLRNHISRFMVLGLRKNCWWWQAQVLLRRGALISILTSVETSPMDAYAFLWTLAASLAIQLYFRPYRRVLHNHLEAVGLTTQIVTVNLALLHVTKDNSVSWVDEFATILMMVVQLGTITYYFYYMLVPFRRWVQRHVLMYEAASIVYAEREVEALEKGVRAEEGGVESDGDDDDDDGSSSSSSGFGETTRRSFRPRPLDLQTRRPSIPRPPAGAFDVGDDGDDGLIEMREMSNGTATPMTTTTTGAQQPPAPTLQELEEHVRVLEMMSPRRRQLEATRQPKPQIVLGDRLQRTVLGSGGDRSRPPLAGIKSRPERPRNISHVRDSALPPPPPVPLTDKEQQDLMDIL
eukprot:PhM_4_TR4985/c0_g1_i1/m.85373